MADHELQKQYREAVLLRMAGGYKGDATQLGHLQALPYKADAGSDDDDDEEDAELDAFVDQVCWLPCFCL